MHSQLQLHSEKSYLKGVRISARKCRLVADLVRGKLVDDALHILKFTNKKAAPIISKMIFSAATNISRKNDKIDTDMLFVGDIFVDEGPTMKRFLPRAQGRATPLRKRSSHITLHVSGFKE